MTEARYDCIIIGAGPAGLAAALYAARDRQKTLVLEKFYPGGQIATTDRIENYPGIPRIAGPELIESLQKQVVDFGAEIMAGREVTAMRKLDNGDIEVTCDDERFVSPVVILAPGSSYRRLGVPGEEKFRNAGAGVSYCGTCDAPFFRNKRIVAIGGGNTAVEETLHLAKFASDVTMIHRRSDFRATKVLVEELMTTVNESGSNLKLQLDSTIAAINGDDRVRSVTIRNVRTGQESELECDGVFVFIGMVPNTGFLKGFLALTEHGFIKADCAYLRTQVPGVFAAGDCRIGAAMQLATAIGDGVLAAMMMKQYQRDRSWWGEPVSDDMQPAGW